MKDRFDDDVAGNEAGHWLRSRGGRRRASGRARGAGRGSPRRSRLGLALAGVAALILAVAVLRGRSAPAGAPAPSVAPPVAAGRRARSASGRQGAATPARSEGRVPPRQPRLVALGILPPRPQPLVRRKPTGPPPSVAPPVLPTPTAADLAVGVAPEPAAARVAKPRAVRGIYLNAWAAASQRRRRQLIALADSTEIDAFVIDVKDASGYVSYPSSIPLVHRVGADTHRRIADIRTLLAMLKQHGIYPIARIVCFKDPVLARARPDWAVLRPNGALWRDQHGQIWVDAFNRHVWDYDIALAREALALGFSEVQWDYVRFPDAPASALRDAVFPARAGRSKEQAVREFMLYARKRLSATGAPLTADVFGLTTSAHDDMGIGQDWALMVNAVDVLLPMVYPSHYAPGSYGIARPNGEPYEVVSRALRDAVRRTRGVAHGAAIRPWLQDFTLGSPAYGAAQVRAEIRAVYDAGLDEWVLWNPGSLYTAAALAPVGSSRSTRSSGRRHAPTQPRRRVIRRRSGGVR